MLPITELHFVACGIATCAATVGYNVARRYAGTSHTPSSWLPNISKLHIRRLSFNGIDPSYYTQEEPVLVRRPSLKRKLSEDDYADVEMSSEKRRRTPPSTHTSLTEEIARFLDNEAYVLISHNGPEEPVEEDIVSSRVIPLEESKSSEDTIVVIDDVESSTKAEELSDIDSAIDFTTSNTLVMTTDITASQTDPVDICQEDEVSTDRALDLPPVNTHDTPDRVSKDVEKTSTPPAEEILTVAPELTNTKLDDQKTPTIATPPPKPRGFASFASSSSSPFRIAQAAGSTEPRTNPFLSSSPSTPGAKNALETPESFDVSRFQKFIAPDSGSSEKMDPSPWSSLPELVAGTYRTGEEDEERLLEVKGTKLFVKRGHRDFGDGMYGNVRLLKHRENGAERIIFRREPLWQASMNITIRRSIDTASIASGVKHAWDAAENILRVIVCEPSETNNGQPEIVIYALKSGRASKDEFRAFAESLTGSSPARTTDISPL